MRTRPIFIKCRKQAVLSALSSHIGSRTPVLKLGLSTMSAPGVQRPQRKQEGGAAARGVIIQNILIYNSIGFTIVLLLHSELKCLYGQEVLGYIFGWTMIWLIRTKTVIFSMVSRYIAVLWKISFQAKRSVKFLTSGMFTLVVPKVIGHSDG